MGHTMHSRSYLYDEPHHQSAYTDSAQSQSQLNSTNFPVHTQSTHRSHCRRQYGSSPYYIPPPPGTANSPPGTPPYSFAKPYDTNINMKLRVQPSMPVMVPSSPVILSGLLKRVIINHRACHLTRSTHPRRHTHNLP